MQLRSVSHQRCCSLVMERWFLTVDAAIVVKAWHCLCPRSLIIAMRMLQEIIRGYRNIVWLEIHLPASKKDRSLGFIAISTALEMIFTTLAFSLLFLLLCRCLSFPEWPKFSHTVKTFDLVKNVFPSPLALHRESEINMNTSELLLWGQQYLTDFPRGRLSQLFWETALHVPLLIPVHISLKGDLPLFRVGFLPSAFAPPEVSVDDKAVRNRRERSSL